MSMSVPKKVLEKYTSQHDFCPHCGKCVRCATNIALVEFRVRRGMADIAECVPSCFGNENELDSKSDCTNLCEVYRKCVAEVDRRSNL